MAISPSRRRSAAIKSASGPNVALTMLGTWMSMSDVCELVDETRSTVDKWRARGVFPTGVRKPNGRIMFRRLDVAEFLETLEEAK